MVAAAHDAAPLGSFYRHLWAVDIGNDYIHALIDECIDSFRLLHRIVPVTGDDHLAGRVGSHRSRAHHEPIAVVEDEIERLGADEPELAGSAHHAGGDAAQVVRLFHVPTITDGVLRVGVLPQSAGVDEQHFGILRRELLNEGPEAEGGRKQHLCAVELDHALHHAFDFDGLRHALLLDQLNSWELGDALGGYGMRLVPSIVITRRRID